MADENVPNGATAPNDIIFFAHAYSDAEVDKLTSIKEEGELLFPKGKQSPSPRALRDELHTWASKKGFLLLAVLCFASRLWIRLLLLDHHKVSSF